MTVAALLLAAGRGERLGGGVPKAFVPLAGAPLLTHALAALTAAESIDFVVPVVAPEDRARWDALRRELDAGPKLLPAVDGGRERQDSMAAGLAALPPQVSHVAVHDAARPLILPEAIDRVVRAGERDGAAILAVVAGDTIKRVRGGRVVETPPRDECYAAQTPQVFAIEILREALAKAVAEGRFGTDDSQIVEALGVPVTVVPADAGNLKVTHSGDVAVAERLLRQRSEGDGAP